MSVQHLALLAELIAEQQARIKMLVAEVERLRAESAEDKP